MNLQDLFSVTTLTSAINQLPVLPTKAGSLGIFTERGIPTTTLVIEVRQGRLFLVPNVSRNDDPQPVANVKRNRRTFETAHLPVSSQVLPSEIQNLSQFGEADHAPADPQAQVINDKLQGLKNSLEATREWQRIGALRGKILDADGGVLVDLYDEFGVPQKKISVALGTATTDVRGKILSAKRHAEAKLGGVLVSDFKAFCGPEWFDKFTDHEKVKAAFANYQEANARPLFLTTWRRCFRSVSASTSCTTRRPITTRRPTPWASPIMPRPKRGGWARAGIWRRKPTRWRCACTRKRWWN